MKSLLILSFFLFFLLVFVSASDEGIVTINLNSSISWWNESILAYGKAEYSNGTPIQNTEVKIFVDKEIVCPSTNSTGDWSCIFTAPKEIKKYQIFVEVENSSNSTILKVSPNYGKLPSGIANRVVYEEPFLIQDLNGKIKKVWMRIIVW